MDSIARPTVHLCHPTPWSMVLKRDAGAGLTPVGGRPQGSPLLNSHTIKVLSPCQSEMCLKIKEINRIRGASCPPPNLKLACFDRLTRRSAKAKDLIQKNELVKGFRFGAGNSGWAASSQRSVCSPSARTLPPRRGYKLRPPKLTERGAYASFYTDQAVSD
jgi:hypothetical protein